jgi:transcription elongation factor SPT6
MVLTKHPSAWDEIHGVFGDGHEYDWALAGDEELEFDEEHAKPEMKYQDVCSFPLTAFYDF